MVKHKNNWAVLLLSQVDPSFREALNNGPYSVELYTVPYGITPDFEIVYRKSERFGPFDTIVVNYDYFCLLFGYDLKCFICDCFKGKYDLPDTIKIDKMAAYKNLETLLARAYISASLNPRIPPIILIKGIALLYLCGIQEVVESLSKFIYNNKEENLIKNLVKITYQHLRDIEDLAFDEESRNFNIRMIVERIESLY